MPPSSFVQKSIDNLRKRQHLPARPALASQNIWTYSLLLSRVSYGVAFGKALCLKRLQKRDSEKVLEHFNIENVQMLYGARECDAPQRGVDFAEKPTRRVPRRGIAVGKCNEPYGYREQRHVFRQNEFLKRAAFQK
ncbi:MAG: hypothetical protein RRY20_05720 [Bilophila sp.]